MSEQRDARTKPDESARDKAKRAAERRERGRETLKRLEEDPPERLEDWPQDDAKYETFGGPEGHHSYEEGPERKLGPSSLTHRPDGTVEIEGEVVDNPQDYKGEPLPGGPTDPNARHVPGFPDLSDQGHTVHDYDGEGNPSKDRSADDGEPDRG